MKKYTELSEKYLHDAGILLKKGELSQTSEKLWGRIAIRPFTGTVGNPSPSRVLLVPTLCVGTRRRTLSVPHEITQDNEI
ncbi:MAG: hypothetical protein HUU08_14835 [Candidatus Brocadia sp.]|nr:hypothetical protein [Candidatus Brocadia sp.]